jgi:hypothetical protein
MVAIPRRREAAGLDRIARDDGVVLRYEALTLDAPYVRELDPES